MPRTLDFRTGDRHRNRARARSGKMLSKWARGEFVAWDTEGAEVAGRHTTIVVSNSVDRPLVNPRGLSTLDILEYMTAHSYPLAWSVGYVFSYDVNMILADLPRHAIARLWLGLAVHWKGYRLEYRARKSFSVKRFATGQSMIVWDVFGFCQSSFVKALKSYDIQAEVKMIEDMKKLRSTFTVAQIADIAYYCREECKALAVLARRIRDYYEEAGLQLPRFDGAGAGAAALLKREGVDAYRGSVPGAVEQASRYAYFGGRVESPRYGHHKGKVYRYDINSAYPSAAVLLPCLRHGHWNHDNAQGVTDCPFTLYRVRWAFERENATLFPFPWRARDGRVFYPPKGEGWYWAPEVAAARDLLRQYVGELRILERWTFHSACEHRPFGFLPTLYRQRQQWKAEGIGAQMALKLSMNALYGKLAQQVGQNGRRMPHWHTLTWAGWITSYTRARLYRAAMQAPESCLMLATDAVYSLKPLALDCGTGLGQWDAAVYANMTLVQSGVYWNSHLSSCTCEKCREHKPETPAGSRGFDALSLDRAKILDGWKHGLTEITATHTKFVGMGEALAGRWERWRTWEQAAPRVLQLTPLGTKREPLAGARPHLRMEPTLAVDPRVFYGTDISTPLMRPWDTEPTVLFTTKEEEESDSWRW